MHWILVTGVPRSATTLVGDVIADGLQTNLLIEPFNPDTGSADMPVRFPYARSLEDVSQIGFRNILDQVLNFRYRSPRRHVKDLSSSRWLLKAIVGNRASWCHKVARFNLFAKNTVVKDPSAVLMAPVLEEQFRFSTIYMVRHPIGVYHSLQRVGWSPKAHLASLLEQPLFREHVLSTVPEFNVDEVMQDEALASAWFWRLINEASLDESANRLVVLHEQLSSDPVAEFERIMNFAGLEFTPRLQERILKRMKADDQPDIASVPHVLTRKSKDIFRRSLEAVDEEDKAKIMDICGDLTEKLYGDEYAVEQLAS